MVISKSKLVISFALHWVVGLFILLAYMISSAFFVDTSNTVLPLSWLIVIVFVWCLLSWKFATGSFFNPYILFLSAIMLFNSGQAFTEIFGLNPHGYLNGDFSKATLEKSLFLTLLCVYIMHLFALITLFFIKDKEIATEEHDPIKLKALRATGMILLIVSIFPSMAQWKNSIQTVLGSGYMGLYEGDSATGIGNIGALLASFLTPAIMFLLAGGVNKKWARTLSLILLITSTSIMFFLGYRATSIMPVAAYFWLYDNKIKKISRVTLSLSGAFLLFVLFPLIRAVRSITGGEKLSINFLKDTYFSIENPVVEIINEMGNSMFTLAHTIQLIPSVREFDLGTSYLFAPLTFFPNFFWDIHPSMNHTYSNWLVWTVDPAVAARGGGYGYSAIAEAYANFGWLAPVVMGLVAVFLILLFMNSLKDTAKIAFVASFLAFFFIYARGESIFVFRTLSWYAFLPYCLFLFTHMLYRSKTKIKTKSYANSIKEHPTL